MWVGVMLLFYMDLHDFVSVGLSKSEPIGFLFYLGTEFLGF